MTEQVQTLADRPRRRSPASGLRAGVARRLVPWLVPVALIVVWQIASSLGWLSTRVLPAPLDVLQGRLDARPRRASCGRT